ncbi:peptidase [Rhizohabitans arisaemae]|uniref:peptidase n=1 Tax=Rhizohabitans arisaemae TaxID=2720610 RepID=UPI0024B237FA|nr:peptidase [Rhizohabitans arisaemae]
MSPRSAVTLFVLVVGMAISLVSLTSVGARATAVPPLADPARDTIGIRLVDAPVIRRADPRAMTYIVDHLKPGTTISRRIEISNTTANSRLIQLYAAAADIKKNRFAFAEGRTANELSGWVSVEPTQLDVPARKKTVARVTVKVPENASSGERYAVLWAENAAAADAKHNIGINHRTGIRVYLGVGPGGEPPTDFAITEITASRTTTGLPVVTATVRNTGGRAVDLSGTLTLTEGPDAMTAGPYPVKSGTTLAPGGVGKVPVQLGARLPDGPWRAELVLRSGVVERTASAMLTFPPPGSTVAAQLLDAGGIMIWSACTAVAVGVGTLGLIVYRRRRRT